MFEIKASFVLIYAVLLHCCINNLEKARRRALISGSRFRALGRSENVGGGRAVMRWALSFFEYVKLICKNGVGAIAPLPPIPTALRFMHWKPRGDWGKENSSDKMGLSIAENTTHNTTFYTLKECKTIAAKSC